MICCKHFEPNMLKPPLFNQLKDDAIPIAEQAETSKTQPKRVKQEMVNIVQSKLDWELISDASGYFQLLRNSSKYECIFMDRFCLVVF